MIKREVTELVFIALCHIVAQEGAINHEKYTISRHAIYSERNLFLCKTRFYLDCYRFRVMETLTRQLSAVLRG